MGRRRNRMELLWDFVSAVLTGSLLVATGMLMLSGLVGQAAVVALMPKPSPDWPSSRYETPSKIEVVERVAIRPRGREAANSPTFTVRPIERSPQEVERSERLRAIEVGHAKARAARVLRAVIRHEGLTQVDIIETDEKVRRDLRVNEN